MNIELILRLSKLEDIDDIVFVQQRAINMLQSSVLTPEQVEASKVGMGLDTQLIDDETYFCVWNDKQLAGCGGWSFRSTLYGGNHSAGRSARRLNPENERARIRAMYTDPDYIRRGVGRMILNASETAAREHGFKSLEMAATLAGKPFYERCGYTVESSWFDKNGSVPVPLFTMVKDLA